MTTVERLAHARSATLRLVVVHVAKERFLVNAETVSNRILSALSEQHSRRAMDTPSILDIKATDL